MATDSKAKVPTHVGKHGDHPVGGAVGAAVGAAAGAAAVGAAQGAALGTVVGVPGMAAGVAIGGVVGALAGKGVAQEINPTTEDVYWSENYKTCSYIKEGDTYEAYGPAYRHGIDAYSKYQGKNFDSVEPELKDEWDLSGQSLPWHKARPATRDAYERLSTRINDNDKR
jgi:hypothetical protein